MTVVGYPMTYQRRQDDRGSWYIVSDTGSIMLNLQLQNMLIDVTHHS